VVHQAVYPILRRALCPEVEQSSAGRAAACSVLRPSTSAAASCDSHRAVTYYGIRAWLGGGPNAGQKDAVKDAGAPNAADHPPWCFPSVPRG